MNANALALPELSEADGKLRFRLRRKEPPITSVALLSWMLAEFDLLRELGHSERSAQSAAAWKGAQRGGTRVARALDALKAALSIRAEGSPIL